jgi:glutamate-ammonia-ligase adenylyltransferase
MTIFPNELQQLGTTLRDAWQTAAFAQQLTIPSDLINNESLVKVLALSDYTVRIINRYPNIMISLWESGELSQEKSEETYQNEIKKITSTATNEKELARQLRLYRQREMVRIIWRHLLSLSSMVQTTAELSYFADAVIEHSLNWLQQFYATHFALTTLPPSLMIVALGKLGAYELNLSSDIDLMYVAPSETNDPNTISFYEKVAQRFTVLLYETTAEGFVFRVDLRLRPYGASGPLIVNIDSLENYYSEQGRDWERYALIKARVVTGKENAKEIEELIRPFVYRRYIDFGAIKALREMHQMIQQEVRSHNLFDDIKRGPGGIREIEFIIQAFQLIRGGREIALREKNLLKVIPQLIERNFLEQETATQLIAAYTFLRDTEHTIQAFRDQQTHRLPKDELDQLRLATVMGFDSWKNFVEALTQYREMVEAEFLEFSAVPPVVSQDNVSSDFNTMQSIWRDLIDEEKSIHQLQQLGCQEGKEVIYVIKQFASQSKISSLNPIARQRLDSLVPLVLLKIIAFPNAKEALQRIFDVFYAITKRSAYWVLLLENPPALDWFVKLCAKSRFISDELSKNPVLLDELLDLRVLRETPRKVLLKAELERLLVHEVSNDLEAQMETLRYFKKVNVLRVAAANAMGWLPLMRVSDSLTYVAEVILECVVKLAFEQVIANTEVDISLNDLPFGIIAYGKFAGFELGYISDLDLVFIYDDKSPSPGPIDNEFYLRLSRRIIHLLSTRTHMGVLYEIDTQLRPLGHAGLLVSSMSYFEEYQNNEAWTWEHQALVRTRLVIGSSALKNKFSAIRRKTLQKTRDVSQLTTEVREMRNKMRETSSVNKNGWDLKKGPGGIVDIEFLVQYLVLRFASKQAVLLRYPDNMRILDLLEATKIIPSAQADILRNAYCTFRDRLYALNLSQFPGIIAMEEYQELREKVIHIWNEWLQYNQDINK